MKKDQPYTLLGEIVPPTIFKDEVRGWADRIGVEPKEIHIRPMRRKWASCSTAGRLTFDTDLLRQPRGFRSEVIVHELLHLKLPNHGKLFRTLVRAHLAPDSGSASLPYDRLIRKSSSLEPPNGFVLLALVLLLQVGLQVRESAGQPGANFRFLWLCCARR